MRSEHDEQAAFVRWAALSAGRLPALRLLFAVPNGGHRRKSVAGRMKAEGVRAGVPDLCLPALLPGPDGVTYGALWIEMKTQTGTLSAAQLGWARALVSAGHAWAMCRGFDEAREAVLTYLDGRHVNRLP